MRTKHRFDILLARSMIVSRANQKRKIRQPWQKFFFYAGSILLAVSTLLAGCSDFEKPFSQKEKWNIELEEGRTALASGQFEIARTHFRQAQDLLQKENSETQKQLGGLLCERGRAEQGLGNSDAAVRLFREGLTRIETDLGALHHDAISCMSSVAKLYFEQENYAAAASLQQRLVVVHEKQLNSDPLQTAESLHDLALSLLARGSNRQAEALLKRAVSIRDAKLSAGDPARIASEQALATAYLNLEKLDLAEGILIHALDAQQATLGRENLETARSLERLGEVYRLRGKFDDAAKCHQQALTIRTRLLGAAHPDTGESMNNLGRVYYGQKKLPNAEALFRRALEIFEQAPPPSSPTEAKTLEAKIATVLQDMARLQLELKNDAEAEPLYRRALELREKINGPNHLEVAKSLLQLARFYVSRELYAKAEPLFHRALEIREKLLDPNAEELEQSRREYARLLYIQGKKEQARQVETSGTKNL